MIKRIDHIVYCVRDLDLASDYIERLTGIRPVYGGRHLSKGTHNALLKVGASAYLELLAIDDENDNVDDRWMGIDLIENEVITRWAIKSDDLTGDANTLHSIDFSKGRILTGSRKCKDGSSLKWQMTDPLNSPAVDIIPFYISWKNGIHPSNQLQDGCAIRKLNIHHPAPMRCNQMFQALNLDITAYEASGVQIELILDTPKGTVQII